MSFDGKWNVTLNTQMGAQQIVLDLKTEGDKLTGTLGGPQGNIDISDGQVNGDEATWKASMTEPMPITIDTKAKVDGDKITGEVQLGSFGSATFEGTRA